MAKHSRRKTKPKTRTVTRTRTASKLKGGAKRICKCRTVRRK